MRQEKIVIIDDCEETIRAVGEQLRLAGFDNITTFVRSTEALDALKSIRPNLVICDVNMPEIDGWQLCKLINSPEYPDLNHVPILLMSATFKDPHSQQMALGVGASAFLNSPYDYEDLMTLVFTLLVSGKEGEKEKPTALKKRALIADDDENILKALTSILEEGDYHVDTARDGAKTIEAIKKIRPHIVLLDYQMPEIDGMEVLKWIRENHPETACIILTAHGSEDTAVNFMKAGADDYLAKPFEFKEIHEACEHAYKKYNFRMLNRQFKEKAMELKVSEEKYRGIVDNSSDLIFTIDCQGRFVFANREADKALGCGKDALNGRPVADFIHEGDREDVLEKLFEKGNGKKKSWQFEFRMTGCEQEGACPGSRVVEVEAKFQDICSEDLSGRQVLLGTLIIARDISERKHIQEQLMQAEKMSTIGTFVSGIAHELNNPLASIVGYSELLMDDPSVRESTKKDLDKIYKEALRCDRIVQNLLTFSRKYKVEKGLININEVVQNTVDLIGYQFTSGSIQVHMELEKDIPNVFGDYHQIQQVFLNFIYNAIHAVSESTGKDGTLWISTKGTGADSISVSFKNNGPPIEDSVMKNIFDPFFTTKGEGEGTGLGLSICRSIMADHGGRIEVGNLLDGVIFKVAFPVSSEGSVDVRKKEVDQKKCAEKKRVLVVEDEEVIRDLMERLLIRDGHIVTTAPNGEAAFAIAKEERFDLVVSDLKMPELSGIALYERLINTRPELAHRFILVTGSIENEVVEFSKKTGNPYIQKPFKQAEFRQALLDVFRADA